MIEILRNATFRRVFLAQVVALAGTGLATVALALLAYELAGDRAGAVLGTALAIKMTVYVLLAPLSTALVSAAKRKAVLIALDLLRAGVVLALPFVTEVWQVYVLIAVLQAASACFTPLFQSLIPEILANERDYTRALSLSRLAYDLESLFSPVLAGALLAFMSFHGLFVGTSVGFVLSALLVLSATFPAASTVPSSERPYSRARRGLTIYLRTPRLRGVLALSLCAAAGGAMVFVNTVVIVRDALGGDQQQVAWALAAFGAGSMLLALWLPRLLDRVSDRQMMLSAAILMGAGLLVTTTLWTIVPGGVSRTTLFAVWAVLGMAYAGLVTPGGRLLRRSAQSTDLPALFAAQFSLSHACWLVAYPLAGWLGAVAGLGWALAALSMLACVGWAAAWRLWPSQDPLILFHHHQDLPPNHPHWQAHRREGQLGHAHRFIIDELHQTWPKQ